MIKQINKTGQNHTFVFIALISFSVSLNTLKIHELTQRGCFAALLCITFVLICVICGYCSDGNILHYYVGNYFFGLPLLL